MWHWNCYPGARVDSHVPNYEFSIEEVWRDWNWTERFPGWEELRRYFDHVDDTLDLRPDISSNTRIDSARFDDDDDRWTHRHRRPASAVRHPLLHPVHRLRIEAIRARPARARRVRRRLPSHRPVAAGRDSIWLDGERVGIIGTGASGVQVLQEASKVACRGHGVPTHARCTATAHGPTSAHRRGAGRGEAPTIPRSSASAMRRRAACRDPSDSNVGAWTSSPSGARAVYEDGVGEGRLPLLGRDVRRHPHRRSLESCRLRLLARQDPGAHRRSVGRRAARPDRAALPVRDQAAVARAGLLRSLQPGPRAPGRPRTPRPIVEITPSGVRTEAATSHDFDLLVLATGFDANTGGLTQIDIRGADGVTPRRRDGPTASKPTSA